jgi:thiol:disulfide interchange protein DsbD
VRERFSELGVRTLKADWTSKDDEIARALADLGRASVPLYLLYVPGKAEPLILPEILTQAIVLRYLDENIAGRR